MTLIDFLSRKLRAPKTVLDKCLNSPVLEDSSISTMVNVSNYFSNLRHSNFIKFIDQCRVN